VVGGGVDIAAVLDADRSDARIRSGGNADRISGGVTGISGGGRDGNVAAVRHTDWAATNGEPTVGSTHRRGARNIPAVLDADGAVDSCGGEDAEVVAAPACCNVAAINDTDGAVAEPGLYTNAPAGSIGGEVDHIASGIGARLGIDADDRLIGPDCVGIDRAGRGRLETGNRRCRRRRDTMLPMSSFEASGAKRQ